jgi:hypothetical protein
MMKWNILLLSFSICVSSAQDKAAFGEQKSATGITHSFLIAGNRTVIVSEKNTITADLKGRSRDGFVLPNGNVLVSMNNAAQEIDPKTRKVIWKYQLAKENKELGTAVRLDDGNT